MKQAAVIWVLILALAHCPLHVAKYIVYPLYMGRDCTQSQCSEDYTCDHTCYLHGLECATDNFDCYGEAVKLCGGKELTMLIRGYCNMDFCDVSGKVRYI
jgi:hypothetical protein